MADDDNTSVPIHGRSKAAREQYEAAQERRRQRYEEGVQRQRQQEPVQAYPDNFTGRAMREVDRVGDGIKYGFKNGGMVRKHGSPTNCGPMCRDSKTVR